MLFFFLLQPDTITGDIVFVLQQKEHPKFKRKGDDLFFEHTLSLVEALCGFHFVLTHLDGRQLLIKSQPGEVVKPGNQITLLILNSCLALYLCIWLIADMNDWQTHSPQILSILPFLGVGRNKWMGHIDLDQ